MPVSAEVVALEEVRPLRQRVLRPGSPEDASVFPHDDDAPAVHAVVRLAPGEPPVAVGSLLPEDPPPWLCHWPGVPASPGDEPGGDGHGGDGARWWRIRGMATDETWRGRGFGRQVLELLLDRAAMAGGGIVWCTARLPATSLYRRAGFHDAGDVFQPPGLGPHLTMWRGLGRR